jgi:hypothetical protein
MVFEKMGKKTPVSPTDVMRLMIFLFVSPMCLKVKIKAKPSKYNQMHTCERL